MHNKCMGLCGNLALERKVYRITAANGEETIRQESQIASQCRSVYRRVELFQPRQFCGLPITGKGFIISFSKTVTELFFKKRLIEG